MVACAQCGSKRVIDDATLRGNDGTWVRVNVHADPDALLLKGTKSIDLAVRVCCDCGHVSLTATALEKAREVFEKRGR